MWPPVYQPATAPMSPECEIRASPSREWSIGLDISTPWAWRRLPNCFRRGGSAPYHHLIMPQPLQVRVIALALAAALLSGCATVPTGAYFPPPTNPATV